LVSLYWEVHQLMDAMSAWTKTNSFPEPIFYASNAAITAWHISDWLWQSRPETREKLKAKFKLECDDKIPKGLHDGLRLFQDAVATDSRTLEICRSIANGSKHMRTMKTDDSFSAAATWHEVVEPVGRLKMGQYYMRLTITDGGKEQDAIHFFIDAAGYWEKLLIAEELMSGDVSIPHKVIAPDHPKTQPYYHWYKN
jgi:hypothetical protein